MIKPNIKPNIIINIIIIMIIRAAPAGRAPLGAGHAGPRETITITITIISNSANH